MNDWKSVELVAQHYAKMLGLSEKCGDLYIMQSWRKLNIKALLSAKTFVNIFCSAHKYKESGKKSFTVAFATAKTSVPSPPREIWSKKYCQVTVLLVTFWDLWRTSSPKRHNSPSPVIISLESHMKNKVNNKWIKICTLQSECTLNIHMSFLR